MTNEEKGKIYLQLASPSHSRRATRRNAKSFMLPRTTRLRVEDNCTSSIASSSFSITSGSIPRRPRTSMGAERNLAMNVFPGLAGTSTGSSVRSFTTRMTWPRESTPLAWGP